MNKQLTLKPNSRQIPSSKQYLSNAKYCDLLYGYLQSISKRDPEKNHCRYIQKQQINFSFIGDLLGMSRQTVSKKFKAMLEGEKNALPLIRYEPQEKKYYLIDLEASIATLVQHNTLQLMVSCLQQKVLSIYVYLLNRYMANGCNQFQFTYEALKKVIGIGFKSTGNNYIINSILLVLKQLGLLRYRQELKKEVGKHEKTISYISWMTNEIDGLPKDLNSEKIQVTYKTLKDMIA